MVKMNYLIIISLFSSILFANSFSYCTNCHNGRKEVKLNSLKKEYIKKRLLELKKENNTMSYIARSLSKKDIEEILKIYGR